MDTPRLIPFLFALAMLQLVVIPTAHGQQPIDWYDLAKVAFTQPDPVMRGPVYGAPRFPESLRELEGKMVQIEGYMLPLTVDNQLYVLSRYPFTECFFCGGAGKETVIELKLRQEMQFELDEVVTIQGRLKLNDDPLELSFVLEEAFRISAR